jgi:hypothetical protein
MVKKLFVGVGRDPQVAGIGISGGGHPFGHAAMHAVAAQLGFGSTKCRL